jgi:predicted DNA-binding transcriptional regulator YafY
MNQRLRLLTILRRLSAGVAVRELAEEFAVDQKTIRRDLDAIRKAGIKLRAKAGSHGKKVWRVDRCPVCGAARRRAGRN